MKVSVLIRMLHQEPGIRNTTYSNLIISWKSLLFYNTFQPMQVVGVYSNEVLDHGRFWRLSGTEWRTRLLIKIDSTGKLPRKI